MDYSAFVRDIPDYPKEGIVFKDLTPLWQNPRALKQSAADIAARFADAGISKVVGAEARGFIVGVLVAAELQAGFVPVRKPGKLPWETYSEEYELEYGTDTMELHRDAVSPGEKVLLIDDLIATGGTIGAIHRLVERCGGEVVGFGCLVELTFLKAAEKLPFEVFSLLKY